MLMLAGVTPAERLLELYDGKWNQSVDHVFEELLYWGVFNHLLINHVYVGV